ncbi:MAG: hypothetical protein QOC94_2922 [Actinoplanes sp.]|nr:hypothetical protein [Actinoplanes sp.]
MPGPLVASLREEATMRRWTWHLVTHPHVVIAAVVDRATGPAYLVEHIDQPPGFRPLRFGPFSADALTLGW